MSNMSTQESGPSVSAQSRRREVKARSSDIFKIHFLLERLEDDTQRAVCNYCGVQYNFSGGYGNMIKHMEKHHPVEFGIGTLQTQMGRNASSSRGTSGMNLFKYSDVKNKE